MTEQLTRAQWRRLALSAYLPTTLSMLGLGAVTPLLALSARALGASVAEAAFVVTLYGAGTLVGALPAGELAHHIGERWAMAAALGLESAMMLAAHFAPDLAVLDVAVFVMGLAAAVLGLARQAYLTDVVPPHQRARALSTLGGVFRIGVFLGPLAGAAIVSAWGLSSAYLLATGTSLAAALVVVVLPDLPALEDTGDASPGSLWQVLKDHARVYATQGVGAASIMVVRAAKDAMVPLWCEALGIGAATTSLLYALSSGVDMLLFYLGGSLMDRHGRRAVSVPSMIVMGIAFALLPLTSTVAAVAGAVTVLGLANGLSSGVVMTIGSDASPLVGRARFLSGWRLASGTGQALGPALISGIAAAASLGTASLAIGAIGVLGAAWLWRWVPAQSPIASRPRRTINGSGS